MTKIKEIRAFDFRIDATREEGVFEGYASVFNVLIPGYNEKVMPGAFKKTLDENDGQVPIFAGHSTAYPLGFGVKAYEDKKGLFVIGELDIENNVKAREYWGLMKMTESRERRKMGLSIGFEAVKESFKNESGLKTRYLHEVSLMEYSPCMYPANPETWITQIRQELIESAKSLTDEEWALVEAARTGTSHAAAEDKPQGCSEIRKALSEILNSYGGN